MSRYQYNLGLRFRTVAEQHADRTALWWGADQSLTYAELDAWANRAAGALLASGVGVGDVVAVAGTKEADTFAAMLACLKIGAAYSVIDPACPGTRVERMFDTLQARMLLADGSSAGSLALTAEALGVSVVRTDEAAWQERLAAASDDEPPGVGRVTGAHPAYVMFTSGSTGFPKGAVMTHANVLNLADWSRATFEIEPDDVLTNVNPLYFDNSVFDTFASLFNGARLVPFHRNEVMDPATLVRKLDEAACTVWFSVPSMLIFLQAVRATDGVHLRSITRFVFGGEGYPKGKLQALYDVYKDTAAFFNVYGPTECTCICSAYRLGDDDFTDPEGLPSLGAIADNFDYLIVDEDLDPVPPGELGELCLLGPNVGLGYYNDPERTAERFVPNPHNGAFRETMYRTGDLVRLDPGDGKLYIHGRRDNQVKYQGYRVELEEIDAALHRLEEVDAGAAFLAPVRGVDRIVAVVATSTEIVEAEVRQELRTLLPEYMVPSIVLQRDALPKNANGKVDRNALKAAFLTETEDQR